MSNDDTTYGSVSDISCLSEYDPPPLLETTVGLEMWGR